MEGVVIGSYQVLRKIGEGGMGAVYLGEHSLLRRRAAIKVLLPALSSQQEIVQRFFNEARAATTIKDAGIVQIFDFGYHTDGSAYIVMEFLEGETLHERLRRFGRLAEHDALRILRPVAVSLAAAHAAGIIHRDLKPENIFLVRDAEVIGGERTKILDFGIAKLTGEADGMLKTQTSAVMGTPSFMSPEQCRGAGQVDPRSDVYALGCVLFYVITGTLPFDGDGIGDIIAAHLMTPPPPPSSRAPGVSSALDAVVLRCLAKAPAERYASMTELAATLAQLQQVIASASPASPRRGGPSPMAVAAAAAATLRAPAVTTPSTPASRRRLPYVIGGGLAVAAIAATVVAGGAGGTSAPSTAEGARQEAPGALALDAAAPLPADAVAPADPCQSGDLDACFRMATADWSAARYLEALPRLEVACERDHAASCRLLGKAYATATVVVRNDVRAAQLYAKACNGGALEGCAALARYLVEGKSVAKDRERGTELARRACEGNVMMGCVYLGRWRLEDGEGDVAASLFQRACDAGDQNGCRDLGWLYINGAKRLIKDRTRGRAILEKLCDAHTDECNELGRLSWKDASKFAQTGLWDDFNEALVIAAIYFQRACDAKSAEGCLNLGLIHSDATRLHNPSKAKEAFERACELGSDEGCAKLKRSAP